jgi:hypothetical protein
MHNPTIRLLVAACALSAVVLSTVAAAEKYNPPRLPNGQPDLQGIWTIASLTSMTRSRQHKELVVPKELAERTAAGREAANVRALEPTDPNAPAPSAGGGGVGGYNSFWMDPGSTYAKINGEYRSSWIVDPADGQLPYTAKGLQIFNEQAELYRNHVDNPEGRPMAERCIIGYGSTGGPPMNNVLYNNNYQFFQTDDHVAIVIEMNHDARIIRLNDEHVPDTLRPWLGDSIGHWEGDTLVVETTNIHPGERLRLNFNQSFYLSENVKIEERFTRAAEDYILYEYTVTDPEIYTQPWRAEVRLSAVDEPMFEYACHEGNYALPNILAGAREEERQAAKE